MTSAPETIAIAGAGIGGLSTALALARHGISSTVFERRSDPVEAGAGIQLGPNATGVLEQLGVLNAVRAVAGEPDGLTIHDGVSGRTLGRFPLGAWMRKRHGAPYLTLHRTDLHGALRQAAESEPRIAITFGSAVARYENRAGVVDVLLGNRQRHRAEALIAADGLWSVLRSQISPSDAPQPTSQCAYRTVVPASALSPALAANDVHVWLSPSAHVVHYPAGQGDALAVIVVLESGDASDGWERAAALDCFDTPSVARLAAPLRDLIHSSPAWGVWRLHTLTPLPRWVDGAVALLGDAAHPLMPFFAQGGGLAIEDGFVLAQSLTRGGPIADRLSSYEAARRRRVQRVLDASLANGRIYHLAGAAAMARNAVIASVPGALMMRRYDWLYGWKP